MEAGGRGGPAACLGNLAKPVGNGNDLWHMLLVEALERTDPAKQRAVAVIRMVMQRINERAEVGWPQPQWSRHLSVLVVV